MRCIWACLSISVSLLAQQANDTVSGTVLNSETGELVKYALVTLMSVPKFDSGHPPQQPVTPVQRFIQTDGSGNFQFDGRPSGGTSRQIAGKPLLNGEAALSHLAQCADDGLARPCESQQTLANITFPARCLNRGTLQAIRAGGASPVSERSAATSNYEMSQCPHGRL
jgi:hypothetical protein